MGLAFRCPACGNAIDTADENAGLTVQCPVCHQEFTTPRPGESFATPAAGPMSTPPPEVLPYSGRIEGRGSTTGPLTRLLLVLAVGSVLLVIVLTLLLSGLWYSDLRYCRTTCAANLHGIGKGLHSYASDNRGQMPIAAHWPEKVAIATGQVNYVGRIGSKRGAETQPAAGDTSVVDGPDGREISNTRNLWTLVHWGGSTPASFICPNGDDQKNDEDNPQAYWDFGKGDVTTAGALPAAANEQAYLQISYGYQVPYGRCGRPTADRDSRTVLAADKGPYGMAAEVRGRSLPRRWPATLTSISSPDDWRPWNSPNHGGLGNGEGQNVLGTDGHVDWYNKPLAGPSLDNIYTQWSTPSGSLADRVIGNAPSRQAPNLTPQSDTDSLIYP